MELGAANQRLEGRGCPPASLGFRSAEPAAAGGDEVRAIDRPLDRVGPGWVAKVHSRRDNVPVYEATGGSIAHSADLALNRLWLAIERSWSGTAG